MSNFGRICIWFRPASEWLPVSVYRNRSALNSLLWVMLLYSPLTDSRSPEDGGHWQGKRMGGARLQLPDCAQVVEQIESGLALHTVQLPQVETVLSECLEELLRLLTHVLDFHVLCYLIWMTFFKTPHPYISKIHETIYKTLFFLLFSPLLKNSTDELYYVADYSSKKIGKAVSKQLDKLILKIRMWPYFEKESFLVKKHIQTNKKYRLYFQEMGWYYFFLVCLV